MRRACVRVPPLAGRRPEGAGALQRARKRRVAHAAHHRQAAAHDSAASASVGQSTASAAYLRSADLVVAIAEALRGNEVLTNLNLIDNSIGGEGAKALVSALRVKGVLKALKIGGNDLGDEGAKAIRDAVSGQEGFELYVKGL